MRTFALMACLLIPSLSTAAVYCVKSETQLLNALASAAVSAVDDKIRLEPGVFQNIGPVPGSQLIDAENFDPMARPKFDHTGSARLLGLRPDLGAYEGARTAH